MRPALRVLSLASLSVTLLSGCLTTQVSLDYEANPGSNRPGPPVLNVGVFEDLRDVQPTYLGAVHTPLVGAPFERVYLHVPAAEVVQNAVLHALSARGMMASGSHARFVLEGNIEDFYCELLSRPHAYVRLRCDLVDLSSNRVLYRHTYEAERQAPAYVPGTGDPVPGLRDLASRALQDAVDRAVDDPRMRDWIENPGRRDGPGHPHNARRKRFK